MNELLMAIALLCQATPSSDGWLYRPESVRKSQAKCQIRVLQCVLESASPAISGLQDCVLKGVVFDPKEKK